MHADAPTHHEVLGAAAGTGVDTVRLFRVVQAADVHRAFNPMKHVAACRWTSRGTRAVVAATSAEGALLEALAHMDGQAPADGWHLAVATVPGGDIQDPPPLPDGWNRLPYRQEVQQWGDRLVATGSALGYRLPSALVPGAHNVLLRARGRPGSITFESCLPLPFDSRLLR